MTEKEFFEKIDKETGLSIDKGDYGFIMGLQTPFQEHSGFQAAGRSNGFIVWKRNGVDTQPEYITEKHLVSEGIEKNAENIINFLNGKG